MWQKMLESPADEMIKISWFGYYRPFLGQFWTYCSLILKNFKQNLWNFLDSSGPN